MYCQKTVSYTHLDVYKRQVCCFISYTIHILMCTDEYNVIFVYPRVSKFCLPLFGFFYKTLHNFLQTHVTSVLCCIVEKFSLIGFPSMLVIVFHFLSVFQLVWPSICSAFVSFLILLRFPNH